MSKGDKFRIIGLVILVIIIFTVIPYFLFIIPPKNKGIQNPTGFQPSFETESNYKIYTTKVTNAEIREIIDTKTGDYYVVYATRYGCVLLKHDKIQNEKSN